MTTAFELSSGFPPKKGPGMGAVTNGGQLENDCPLFVWQNQGNFMQSVIKWCKMKELTFDHDSYILPLSTYLSVSRFIQKHELEKTKLTEGNGNRIATALIYVSICRILINTVMKIRDVELPEIVRIELVGCLLMIFLNGIFSEFVIQ